MPTFHKELVVSLALVGCASNGGGGGGGGTDAGASRPPMTNGVSTLAGFSDKGYLDGSRDVNLFHNPVNVAYGPDGKLYVADFDNGKLRVVDSSGTASTLISQQGFSRPFAMAFAADGTLWVSTDADLTSHTAMSGTIWKVDINAHSASPVSVDIGRPRGIAPLADGRLAVSDYEHHVIEIVDPHSGAVTNLAGTWDAIGFADATGAAARFSTPYGMVQRADGKLVVCDWGNHRLRVVGLDGQVTTLAGTGTAGFADGAMATAQLNHPEAIAIAANGDLFVADTDNFRIRRVTGTSITAVVGTGTGGYIDSDDLLAAELYGLEGLTVKPDGSMVFVADGTRGDDLPYNRIRQIKMP